MNAFLFRLLVALFPLQWGPRYTRLDRTPSSWELRVVSRLSRIQHSLRGKNTRTDRPNFEESASFRRLQQRFQAFSVPSLTISHNDLNDLPAIRLLWVAHPKDFDVLPHSVLGALRHVKNPIAAIDVVSPSPDKADNLLTPLLPPEIRATYLSDADIVPGPLREALSQALVTHGGWATQQVIKILMAMRQASESTLVIDSDTVLLQDKIWLTSSGRQLLYFRGYTNTRYHRFLRSWGLEEIDTMKSFVTHHMLFQPKILKPAIKKVFGSTNPTAIVDTIISSAKQLGFPEFSLDYELYGNVLWSDHPSSYRLDKYSNTGMARPESFKKLTSQLTTMRDQGRYNSASFHRPDR